MSGSSPIKVAGIGLSWNESYAKSYVEKLQELGFFAKKIPASASGAFLVGYSYRPFTAAELFSVLDDLLKDMK